MSPLPLIVVNPASAGGATGRAWPRIASDVSRHFGPFQVAFTGKGGEAADMARRESAGGRAFIIACGGDGTISEVANGILSSGAGAELGVLSSGTGGDFRRTLEVPARAADAARLLRDGSTRLMDVGRVSFVSPEGRDESRYFLNVASFGMGGEVIKRVKDSTAASKGLARLAGGRVSFAVAALRSSVASERPAVRVELDGGRKARLSVTNFCVANARYFGGGMKIAPLAKLDDGLFDVVSVGDLSAASILVNSYRLYLGTHLGMKEVRHTRAKRIEAHPEAARPVELEVDGELVGHLPAIFEILPAALKVRCPTQSQ